MMCDWSLCPYTGERCGDCDKRQECRERVLDIDSQADPVLITEDDLNEAFG